MKDVSDQLDVCLKEILAQKADSRNKVRDEIASAIEAKVEQQKTPE